MKKKTIKYLILFVVIFAIFFIVYSLTKQDKNLLKRKIKIGDITFSKVMIYKKDDNYVFKVNLDSKKDNDSIESIDVYIKDQNGDVITILSSYIDGIKKNETKEVVIDSTVDILNAYSVNYTVNKKWEKFLNCY